MQHSPSTSAPRTLIIADDLTGACDAAVAFSHRGVSTRVLLGNVREFGDAPEVFAIDTETRDVPPETATERLALLARNAGVSTFPCVFKKIDSVFRGNTVVEIAAAIQAFPSDLAVIAPAYPALGRTSVSGSIHVRDLHGERTIPALELIHAAGFNAHLIPPGRDATSITAQMLGTIRSGKKVVYCDAVQQNDLANAVQAALGLRLRVLWVGSGGLAHALAASYAPGGACSSEPGSGRVLIFAGTDHPVTDRQLQHLRSELDVALCTAKSNVPELSPDCDAVLVPVQCGVTTELELRALADSLDKRDIGCLFMTGGDTAALVCRALDIEAIDLEVECEPGLPQGLAAGGPFAGHRVVLKSGGFGDAQTISRIVDRFSCRKGVS